MENEGSPEHSGAVEEQNLEGLSQKNALKAGVWYVISNVMLKAVAVITTPIFTRLLTTEQYGMVQTFTSWYSLLMPVITLNLTYSIGRAKLDFPGKLDDYVGSMQLLSGLLASSIVLVVIPLVVPVSDMLGLTTSQTILLAAYLAFAPAISFKQNSFRYRYRYRENIAIAWYTIILSTSLSLFLIFFMPSINNANSRILGLVAPCIALSVAFWISSICKGNCRPNRQYWKYGLSLSLPLLLHTISMQILSQSDRVFISKFSSKTDVALYSLAYTYGLLMNVVTNAAAEGWLPWFHDTYYAGKFEEIRKAVRPLIVLGCYVCLAAIALAPEAVALLGGDAYVAAVPCVAPVSLGVLCQYVYTHYVNIELHLKKTIYVSRATAIAAALNIVLNVAFIPQFGFIAAAYTTLVCYIVLMLMHYQTTRCVLGVRLYDDKFMIGSIGVVTLIAMAVQYVYRNTSLRYAMIVIGFITFLWVFRGYIKKWTIKANRR